jgi:hypothetical protein
MTLILSPRGTNSSSNFANCASTSSALSRSPCCLMASIGGLIDAFLGGPSTAGLSALTGGSAAALGAFLARRRSMAKFNAAHQAAHDRGFAEGLSHGLLLGVAQYEAAVFPSSRRRHRRGAGRPPHLRLPDRGPGRLARDHSPPGGTRDCCARRGRARPRPRGHARAVPRGTSTAWPPPAALSAPPAR